MAIITAIEWLKHPYKGTKEVEVRKLTRKNVATMLVLSLAVTLVFYFILQALGNSNLIFSTVSVTTSFIAAYLTFLRSPYYALGYAVNDMILIVLWVLAAIDDFSYFPMIICFILFLVNDLYGFVNWKRMQNRQN
jgi:nicotinamide mononucleotide transporter PnuC